MFYLDECVCSTRYGLGVVIWAGDDPSVEILAGERLQVEGSSLQVVPDDVYDAEVAKRARVDRWLTWRVTGRLEPELEHVARQRSGLEDRIRRSAGQGCLPMVEDSNSDPPIIAMDEPNHA